MSIPCYYRFGSHSFLFASSRILEYSEHSKKYSKFSKVIIITDLLSTVWGKGYACGGM